MKKLSMLILFLVIPRTIGTMEQEMKPLTDKQREEWEWELIIHQAATFQHPVIPRGMGSEAIRSFFELYMEDSETFIERHISINQTIRDKVNLVLQGHPQEEKDGAFRMLINYYNLVYKEKEAAVQAERLKNTQDSIKMYQSRLKLRPE